MTLKYAGFALASLLMFVASPADAQEPKIDSATIRRANRPIIRVGELLGVLGTTTAAFLLDQEFRDRIHDPHDSFGRALSDVGNAFGDGLVVYPSLIALTAAGKALGKPTLYGVSSRALKSVAVAGVGAMVLKTIIGRERPEPENAHQFHPFTFKDNSFPSGHATVAFALATSFAREIEGQWDDVAFFTLASLTGYSRMHDDRHWMSDVVFGAGVGILSARFIHRREAKILLGKNVLGMSLEF